MGKDVSTPPAPDPTQVANAQSGYDKNTALFNAQLNRYGVSTPYGSLNWDVTTGARTFNQGRYDAAAKAAQGAFEFDPESGTITGRQAMPDRNDAQFYDDGAPQYAQRITLNPTAQATLNATQGNALNLAGAQGDLLSNVRERISSPMDTSRLPGFAGPVAQGDLTGLANKATKASFDSAMELLQPEMDIQRRQLNTELANKGIPVGSEGFQNQMGTLDRQQDFTRTQAANNAVLSGMNYDNQLFNQGLNNANLQNYANSQGLQQMLSLRNQPLNEYLAMQNGTQIQSPQFQSYAPVSAGAPNYQQAVQNQYQGQLNAYNAATGANNSMMSGLFNMGAAALPFIL